MLLPTIFFAIYFYCAFVQCLIEDLTVQKFDRKLIQRKRQDTLDMCRLFNAEIALPKNHHPVDEKRAKRENSAAIAHIRSKREFRQLDDGRDNDQVRKIKATTDKPHNGVKQNEETLNKIDETTKDADKNNVTFGRRFNFAPAKLSGPSALSSTSNTSDGVGSRIPWHKVWKHGIIPYFIDPKTYDSHLGDIIRAAFDYFEKSTCIRLQRLRDRPTDRKSLEHVEWLYITNPTGIRQCVHSNERKPNKGVQMVVFGYNCMKIGEIVHEIMHVLGFSHEHTRFDRDNHLKILWDNIKPGYKKYFEKRSEDVLSSFPYDYRSVLHYPPRAFSKNGQLTISPESGIKVGQREGMSEIDAQKVDMIFGVDCVERNTNYLLKTCPSVVRTKLKNTKVTQKEIEEYFQSRLWPFGIINYKIRDKMEFSYEERENIKAVIRHIETETCLEFREMENTIENQQEGEQPSKELHGAFEKKVFSSNSEDTEVEFNNTENKQPEIKDIENITSETNRRNAHSSENEIDGSTRAVRNKSLGNEHGNITNTIRKPRAAESSTPASRRHASDVLVFTRSNETRCVCPQPGRPGGEKELQIGVDCFNSVNDLLHLFVHVLGLDHQHNTHDRDSYLHILWDKLTPEINDELSNLLPPAASAGFPYDYQSVMHYPWLQIKNGFTNIMYPIWNDGWAMGHWQGLSSTDVQKLNLLYFEQCQERKRHVMK